MSTQIGKIVGRQESFVGQQKIEKELYLTRFFGGTKRGTSLQLTITGDINSEYIQLDNDAVQELIQILVASFPQKDTSKKEAPEWHPNMDAE
jgi:hypothetical protein